MKKILATTATLVASAAIAAPLLGSGVASADGDGHVRLKLIETSTGFHVLDIPAPAADGQAGDTSTFESDLAKSSGVKVGTLAGQCTQLRADGTLDDCSVTVTVGRSSYRMSGIFDPASGGTLAIVGGTGAWVGAGGTDTITNRPDGTAVHTIDLKLG